MATAMPEAPGSSGLDGRGPRVASRVLRRWSEPGLELLDLFATGRVRPHIGAVFLSQAGAALRHVADRRAVGKVIIDTTR